ncbi:MAG: DUF1015 domain-containing protein [Clostridia bacterium]|nr:DUF1015 domain-containing protein [Clostridia bacterium]
MKLDLTKHAVGFDAADILLPNFDTVDGSRWAVVACDQYTSEPDYWNTAEEIVGDAPSTLRMILPEVYLEETESRVPKINNAMHGYLQSLLQEHPHTMIALERTQSNGTVRRGIVGAVDLECYDYKRGSASLIRATEGTVLERIPPRVAIRRDAPVELPHVMLLIDDPKRTVIEPVLQACATKAPLYDFDLMLDGGHVRAHRLQEEEQSAIRTALAALIEPCEIAARYGDASLAPLLFAVGDGNHSLATAKAVYEDVKATLGADAAKVHPARYALVEIVNLHDDALQFEPIYRVVFGADPQELLHELRDALSALDGSAAEQTLLCVTKEFEERITVPHPVAQLTVGTLQAFLDDYLMRHPEATVDYIHGEDSLRALASQEGAIGFLFDGMRKDELFRTVIFDGALPRKTFSMGHAPDKRYYIECRKIK